MSVHYEFEAFPATYRAHDRGSKYNPHGYIFGCLLTFTFDTLTEAKREMKRLKRIYKLAHRPEYDLLKIYRVVKTPVETR